MTLVGEQVTVPTAEVNDDQLHRYGVRVEDGKHDGGTVEVRFLLFKKPNGVIVSVADACQICGPVGFYMGDQGITCKMCASPLMPASMGRAGRMQSDSAEVDGGRWAGDDCGGGPEGAGPVFGR